MLANGGAELREQATPALPLMGLLAMTTVFVGLIAVIVDLLAVAGRQAALAGLGLLVLYCVPVATITGGIGFLAVAAPAVGLAVLLWTDQRRRVGAPSRPAEPGLAALLGTGHARGPADRRRRAARRAGRRRRRPDPVRGFPGDRPRRRAPAVPSAPRSTRSPRSPAS